ncbi:M23 family metallopeptidase [Haloglycomyces albus]|uniref:M23 family metallopeptidase n=1 Tax=Haloglycomyces albus TaxID=526067 RepID=UPI0004B77849|nr:M23 family metallopeptidase [Haloglycomyces albus]
MAKHQTRSDNEKDQKDNLRIRAFLRHRLMNRDRNTWRIVAAALTAVVITGSSIAYASTGSDNAQEQASIPGDAAHHTYKPQDDTDPTPPNDEAEDEEEKEDDKDDEKSKSDDEKSKDSSEGDDSAEKKPEPSPEPEVNEPDWQLPSSARISSQFGQRWGTMHNGADFAANMGSDVSAIGDGTVTFTGWNGGFGQLVIIDHGNGVTSYYGHNSQLNVSEGQSVSKGETIAAVGSTGDSTGPHIHLEIRINGEPTDPLAWLRERDVDV